MSPSLSPSPSGTPATPSGATSSLSLVFGDQQGSATVMMGVTLDASGAMAPASLDDPVARNAYTPYGAVRGADNLPTDHGWLNQVSDEASTGLVYLNARYYDPEASRFVSPDPLLKPMDPRTLDAYRYAENNPITYTDATGLWSCPGSTDSAGYKTCISMRTRLLQPEGFNYTSYTVGRERETKLWAIEQMKIRDAKANAEAAKFNFVSDVLSPATHGLVNYGGGFVNGATSMINSVTGLVGIPKIGTIKTWGRYDLYKYSSWFGTAGTVEVSFMFGAGEASAASKVGEAEEAATQAANSGLTSLEQGATKVPQEWGPGNATSKGTGLRWEDPGNPGNGVRIDEGVPNSPWPSQQVDHVVVRTGGQVLGPDGQPIVGSIASNPQAHIPLTDGAGAGTGDSSGLGREGQRCVHDGLVLDGRQASESVLSAAPVVGAFDPGDDRDA